MKDSMQMTTTFTTDEPYAPQVGDVLEKGRYRACVDSVRTYDPQVCLVVHRKSWFSPWGASACFTVRLPPAFLRLMVMNDGWTVCRMTAKGNP